MELKSDVGDGDAQNEILEREEDQKELQQQEKEIPKSFHVLAVDDSVIDRKLLQKLLSISSYQVTCVDSGDKALEYLGLLEKLDTDHPASSSPPQQPLQQEGSKVNLIMTDYCMPGMSGYDLLKIVKGSSWKDVPVVVMSSENVPSRISMCLEEGADQFLLKPLQLSDLEKLQPYVLKTSNSDPYTVLEDEEEEEEDLTEDNNENNDNNNNNKNESEEDLTEDNNENTDNNNNNNNESNNYKNNSSYSKRKALSAESPDRRPKMKELAVL